MESAYNASNYSSHVVAYALKKVGLRLENHYPGMTVTAHAQRKAELQAAHWGSLNNGR